MATTIAAYPLSSSRNYQIPFEYLARRFVFVTLVGPNERRTLASTEYRFTDSTHVETNFQWSFTDGFEYIEIKRITSATDRLVDFNDGSILRAVDLNVSQIQSLHIAEEGRDALDDRIGLTPNNELDARKRKIINLAPGVALTDAVNLNQLKGTEANAEQSRRAAEAAAEAAKQAVKSINAVPGSYLTPRVPPYNAAGDGLTNDTAAFAHFERDHVGRTVDLGGAHYKVDSLPSGNVYINGVWKLSGTNRDYSRVAFEGSSVLSRPPVFHCYGGGMNRMRADLCNPLVQEIGIVWIGDSITWGSGTGENANTEPRDQTLRSTRDYFSTPSYVNNMRRYIIEEYLPGSTVTTEKWFETPDGDAIVHARKREILLPWGTGFSQKLGGAGPVTIALLEASNLPTQKRVNITNENPDETGSVYGSISFTMTGREFTLLLGLVTGSESDYQIFVNGVAQGRFSCAAGTPTDDGGGMIDGAYRERTHTFPYVRNGVVEIRQLRPVGHPHVNSVLRIGALIINRHFRLTNNGINGSAFLQYRLYNMPPTGVTYSGKNAIGEGDLYTYVQFGSNDRGMTQNPQTVHGFMDAARSLLSSIPTLCVPILTCANPAVDAGANLSMYDIRGALNMVAREKAIDFVDGYAAFRGLKMESYATDKLHPNPFGFAIMAQNVIGAIEQSMDIGIKPPPPPVPITWALPTDPRFATSGTMQVIDRENVQSLLGKQRLLRKSPGQTGRVTIKVTNSDTLIIAYSSLTVQCMGYTLFVNGLDMGRFSTVLNSDGGGTQIYANTRTHKLPTKGEHTIEIEPVYSNEWPGTTQVFYFEGAGVLEGADFT